MELGIAIVILSLLVIVLVFYSGLTAIYLQKENQDLRKEIAELKKVDNLMTRFIELSSERNKELINLIEDKTHNKILAVRNDLARTERELRENMREYGMRATAERITNNVFLR